MLFRALVLADLHLVYTIYGVLINFLFATVLGASTA